MKKFLLTLSVVGAGFLANAQVWTEQYTGFPIESRGIAGLSVVDASTVWAIGFDGSSTQANVQEYTRTSDGGTTWTSGVIDVQDTTVSINNISAVDANTAWVCSMNQTDGTGSVFKTSDGGATWEYQISALPGGWSNWVHFFDASHGVYMGDPVGGYFEINVTSDGGTTWTRVPSANMPAQLSGGEYGYNGGYVNDGNTLYFYTNRGRILKSTDMGNTWTVALTNGTISDFGSAAVNGDMTFSGQNGLVVRRTFNSAGTTPIALTLHRTTNGGTTWSSVTYSGISAASLVQDVTYVPGTTVLVATVGNGAAATATGGSFKSLDNGTTWTLLDNEQHLGVRCLDINTCYSGGFSSSINLTGMFKTATALGVKENAITEKTSVYPNPSKGDFTITTNKKVSSVEVYDTTGKIVKSQKSIKVDLSSSPNGVYMMKVNFTDGTSTSKKLIKE